MARIELRNSIIRIIDGHSASGQVANGPGYVSGDTTMVTDTFTTELEPDMRFTVVGSSLTHLITSEVGNPNTSITFTPALDGTVDNDAVITVTGRTLEINVGDGNITFGEKKEYNYDLNRGDLDTVREGNQIPMDVSMNFIYNFIKAASADVSPSPEEALKNIGKASGWVSSSSDTCEPYAVDLEIEHTPTCTGTDKERVTLPDFRYESLDHDPREASISATGRCNEVCATVTRGAP